MRQICSLVSGHFQQLLTQQEARQRQQLSQQQPQQVRAKMLKRLSTDKTTKSEQTQASDKPPLASKPQPEHVPDSNTEQSSSSFDIPELPDQDWILRDWSTSLHSEPSDETEVLEEISRHFSAITKEPSRRRPPTQIQGPRLKRLSVGPEGGSLSKRKKQSSWSQDRVLERKLSSSQDSFDELLPPIRSTKTEQHDGIILIQHLEDTTGIKVPDHPDLFVTKSKTRLSLDGSFPPSTSNSQHTLEQMEVTPISPLVSKGSAPPELTPAHLTPPTTITEDNQTDREQEEQTVLRTSLLLETKEEGDKETRIDGDDSGTILLQTVMSEKETAIVGREGRAVLLPASNLQQYEQEEKEEER